MSTRGVTHAHAGIHTHTKFKCSLRSESPAAMLLTLRRVGVQGEFLSRALGLGDAREVLHDIYLPEWIRCLPVFLG